MKAYEAESNLNDLIGQKISVDNKSGKVIRWSLKDAILKITMDTQDIVILETDIPAFLERIEMPQELAIHPVPTTTMIHAVGKELSNIIMDNIRKVQKDKDYINQAREVNANIKSMIDLAKTEIEYMKTLAFLHKKR